MKKNQKQQPPLKDKKLEQPYKVFSKEVILCVLVLLISWWAFSPSLNNEFTNWDDPEYVLENESIRDIKGGFYDMMTGITSANYHPITMLSLAFDYKRAGVDAKYYDIPDNGSDKASIKLRDKAAKAFHSTNLSFHLINVLLVFILTCALSQNNLFMAFFTSMVFGVHPMHVESVAWISERKDVLHVFFYLCALLTYFGYHRKEYGSPLLYFSTIFFFVFSLLSKATAVTLPIVMVLCDLYWNRKFDKRAIIEKSPFIILSLIFGVIAVIAQSKISIASADTFTLFERLMFSSYGFSSYLLKFIWPVDLSAFYPYPPKNDIGIWFYLSPLVLAFGLFLGVKSLRKFNAIALGWLFFIVTIALVLQFVSVGSAIMADRYSYLPYVGLAFAVSYWISQKLQSGSTLIKTMLLLVSGVFLMGCTYATYQRNQIWKNSETLWSDVIKKHPEVPVAYKNRGTYLAKNGRNEEALQDFNKYLELNPKDPLIFSNRGNLFSMQAKYDNAIRDYTASLQLDSTSHEAWFNRGYTYFLMRRYSEAVHDYTVAMDLNGELKERSLANRAMALVESGDPIKSLQDVEQLLSLDKSNSEYYHIGAIAYLRMEQVQKAIDMVNEAIRINGDVANYYNTRAVCNNKLGIKDQTLADLLIAKSLGYPVDDNLLRSLGHTP